MELGYFGWRGAVLLAVVLVAIYLMVSLLGLARLRRRRRRAPAGPAPAVVPEAAVPTEPELSDTVAAARPPAVTPEPDFAFAAELSAQLAKTELEAEVRQLKIELAALRQELAELKVSRRVSPLYAEAAALAQRGFDARGVAEECGISVAEAELVLAMSRDSTEFDREVDDGADRR